MTIKTAGIALLVLAGFPLFHAVRASEWSGRVTDALNRPIPQPRICWQADSTVCVSGNDTGHFRLQLPIPWAGIGSRHPEPFFRLEVAGGRIVLHSTIRQSLRLDWFDSRGRLLTQTSIAAGSEGKVAIHDPGEADRTAGGVRFLRVSGKHGSLLSKVVHLQGEVPLFQRSSEALALSKASAMPLPRVIVTKFGYRRTESTLYQETGLNWITMGEADDSGYFRTITYRTNVAAIDSGERRIHTRRGFAYCFGATRFPVVDSVTFGYGLAGGKLYLMLDSECQGMRLGGADNLIGTWNLEDLAGELPISIRPDTCPPARSGSRPVEPPSSGEIRISPTELTWSMYVEKCPGWMLVSKMREHFGSDTAVQMAESRCRRAVFRKGPDEAVLSYTPFGAQESTLVSYEFKGEKCAYVEPLGNADSPKECPSPSVKALHDFLACVDGSGFAKTAVVATKLSPAVDASSTSSTGKQAGGLLDFFFSQLRGLR